MVVVKRALLSCSDKSGLESFAKTLIALGIELIASDGTAAFLRQHQLPLRTVEQFTGLAEQLDGRLKTLHPKLYAGILARRDVPSHRASVQAEDLIDLVVVNLYPFERLSRQQDSSLQELIEQIDVGGVSLLRAAAKNFVHVAVASNPSQYSELASTLKRGGGSLPEELSRQLAIQAFEITSRYDTLIAHDLARYQERSSLAPTPSTATLSQQDSPLRSQAKQGSDEPLFPEIISVTLRKHQTLRYGENPHQKAAWYVPASDPAWALATLKQLQGKELSYNNLLDIDAALRALVEFEEPTCTIVKHHSHCGMASAATLERA